MTCTHHECQATTEAACPKCGCMLVGSNVMWRIFEDDIRNSFMPEMADAIIAGVHQSSRPVDVIGKQDECHVVVQG